MKLLIVGLGAIAKRHIQNIYKFDHGHKIFVFRQHSKEMNMGELKSMVEDVFLTKEDALNCSPDITFITNPAPFHVATALDFARQGSHLFIEKPLSTHLRDIDVLFHECETRDLILMVGYVLRFYEPMKILKQVLLEKRIGTILSAHSNVGFYLPYWRPESDYRQTVSAKRHLSGGLLFELSHEIDYLRWLLGEVVAVHAQLRKVSDLNIDVEDTAKLVLHFESKILASVHLDMVDHAMNRSCRIVGSEGTLVWNSEDNDSVKIYFSKEKQWKTLYQKPMLDQNEMYIQEIKHFFNCVVHHQKPLIGGQDAQRAIEIALAANLSSQENRVVQC